MGLIKAIVGAAGGVLADQWKEYFYCEAIDESVLVTKGMNRAGRRSSNTRGSENVISNGSVIAVNSGQCMIIVDQGKVVELCAEPGEFTYDTSTEPSIFSGNLGTSIKETFINIGKRFTYGGEAPKDQRVYYFNTKEIIGNKYGTATPVPFRVVDEAAGINFPVNIRCNGEYSYRIVDPILFYTNVCGNVDEEYDRSRIDSMLKTELMTALQPAFARISAMKISYDELYLHTEEITNVLNETLSAKWQGLRGIAVVSFGINAATPSEDDVAKLQKLYETSMYRNPGMAAGAIVGAQTEAMRAAAANENGAMMGFMGLGMAQQAGGVNAQNLFAMEQQAQPSKPAAEGWLCVCGQAGNTGKFCAECGTPQPAPVAGWNCACGTVNKGKFCMNCGSPKPAGIPMYKCDKCGWEPDDPQKPPKFCPECGDLFDDGDIKS